MFTDDFIFELQRFKTINNTKDKNLLSGTSDDDSIYNTSSNVTIEGGDGNEIIYGFKENSTLSILGNGINLTKRNKNFMIVSKGLL